MKTLTLLLSCSLFTTLLSASCDDTVIETLEEKFYIDTTQIHLEENKIFIDAEGILYETPPSTSMKRATISRASPKKAAPGISGNALSARTATSKESIGSAKNAKNPSRNKYKLDDS